MKHSILQVLLFLFVVDSALAQSIEELNSRRIKERNQYIDSSSYKGRHKKSIDWDVDDDTWGFAYTYSPHFPINLSANYTCSYFSITGELGAPLTGEKYDVGEYKDMPILYVMAAPGFYCKYFSIHYGVGCLFNIRDYPSSFINGIPQQYSKELSFAFCHKPSVTGYIPICDGDYYITINAGYMFVPKFKGLNGFTCGIGFQIEL